MVKLISWNSKEIRAQVIRIRILINKRSSLEMRVKYCLIILGNEGQFRTTECQIMRLIFQVKMILKG